MKNLSDVMLNMKNKRLEEQKAIKNKSKKVLSEGKLIWTSEIEATDGYIDEQDYEIVREDFEENILPSIKNQCRNDVLIMAGTVGRWNGNSKGGTVIDVDNLLGFGDVDEVSIEEENGQLIWKGSHHDGTHYMGLYTIPEDEMSRKKIVKDFGIIEWLEDIYDYRSKEDCMEDALSRLDDVESLKDCLSIEDYSKANEYFKPITGAGITENKETVTEADEVTIQGLVNAQNIANQFKNYKAFEPNFGPLIIIKSGNDFLVYKANATEYNQYVYSSDNKDNIEGWLYGAVQAKNGMLNENKEVTEDRVHRELHRGDEFKNENGVTVIIYDVDDKGQVTYKIGNETKCNNKDSVVSMLNQNGYKAIIENKEIVEGIDEETLNLIDKNYGINEDQYDNERRKGRPSAKKIAEQEYYDNEEWYKEHIKDYKNIDDFVQQEIFNIASEYNLKEDTAIQTCKEIYNLATNQ